MKPKTLLVACAAASVAAACAHAPPPPFHSTHLTVLRANGGFFPLLTARVAGVELPMLLDTGASQSVLPSEFVLKHKLSWDKTSQLMAEGSGLRMVMNKVDGVPVQFDGEPAGGKLDFFMSWLDRTGWGVLSPRSLLRPGWALIIDMEGEELRSEPEQEALQNVSKSNSTLRKIEFDDCSIGLVSGRVRVVSAIINGRRAAMLLDTGASRSMVMRDNPAMATLQPLRECKTALQSMASVSKVCEVDGVTVGFSQTQFVGSILVQPLASDCWQGVLGSDVLRHCTLVWGNSSLWAACRAPTAGP